ncbi:hypothetical protein [Nonomuraea sp. NPDC049400]|uniref:hypothetical protein n=1 Tax=Nonomuraea sp. NPDC049400 TaxID=3364352 RepID=UPI0037A4D549
MLERSITLAYYRTYNEVVVEGHYLGRPDDDWMLTFRDGESPWGAGPAFTLSHRQLRAIYDWPQFFTTWHQFPPASLDDLTVLLDYLGVEDQTEPRARAREQADWMAMVQEDTFEDGPVQDDHSDLPPEPHPDDCPPEHDL